MRFLGNWLNTKLEFPIKVLLVSSVLSSVEAHTLCVTCYILTTNEILFCMKVCASGFMLPLPYDNIVCWFSVTPVPSHLLYSHYIWLTLCCFSCNSCQWTCTTETPYSPRAKFHVYFRLLSSFQRICPSCTTKMSTAQNCTCTNTCIHLLYMEIASSINSLSHGGKGSTKHDLWNGYSLLFGSVSRNKFTFIFYNWSHQLWLPRKHIYIKVGSLN